MSYNPMSADDYEAIRWLEERSKKLPALSSAWKILKKYYDECKDYLKRINEEKSPFDSLREKNNIYSFVSQIINNETFMIEVEEFFGASKENVEEYLQKKDNDWIIAKIARLYNMRLKLGHSARITYIAEEGLRNIPDGDNSDLLKRTVLLSALLHDVGRFYQAANYNDLFDSRMKKAEEKIGDLEVDHAIAGYYYSLASALELHKLNDCSKNEEILRYVTEAIAAVVVKCHQKSNMSIGYFDFSGSLQALDSPTLFSDLYKFIGFSYEQAKLMNFDVKHKIDSKHREFIDIFINKLKAILYDKELDYSFASGFDLDQPYIDTLYSELNDEVTKVIEHAHGLSVGEVSDKILNVVNGKVNELSHSQLKEEEKAKYKKEIEDLLAGMLDYDIASSIEEIFKNEIDIPLAVRFLISSSMSMTMDADKIDILNQRALGIYNTSYHINSFDIFPPNNMSLREILNYYFHFNINDEFVISKELINVFQNMNTDVQELIHRQLGNIDIFDLDKFPIGTKVKISNDTVTINEEVFKNNELFRLLNDEWNEYVTSGLNLERLDFKDFKKKYFRQLQLSISRDDLDNNLGDSSDLKKQEAYKKLLVSEGMKKRFMLDDDNKIQIGWILDSEDSDCLINSSISGLLWQLNQFIMVNMRNKHSYEFIEKNHILDQIYEHYLDKDPNIAAIIKEYIDYCKRFIRQSLEKINGDTLTANDLEEMRKTVYNGSGESNNIVLSDNK